jgi:UDP-GlcNAc:undecaprenyl-phosphate GlcNAc-1-phosphate transferase
MTTGLGTPGWISLGVTIATMALLRPFAKRLGLIDHPSGHKRHRGAIPVIGGIAMLAGLVAAVFATPGGAFDARVFVISATALVVVGVLDDAFRLSPPIRLLAHMAAALWMYWASSASVRLETLGDLVGLGAIDLSSVSMLATAFVIVAAINAFNMLDGLDGLAGGVALVALALLFGPTSGTLGAAFTQMSLALIGGLLGFLFYNAPLGFNGRLRSFMGDAGSTLLGFSLGTIMIGASQGPARVAAPVTMVWLVLVPSTDLVWSVLRRLVQRRSPLSPDTEHLHHVLDGAGLATRTVWLLLVAVSAVAGLAGLALDRHGTPEWLSFALLLATGAMLVLAVHGARLAARRALHDEHASGESA